MKIGRSCDGPQIIRALDKPPRLYRRLERGFRRRRSAIPYRSRAECPAEGRRAAAAIRRTGRHRPGLPARRRDRAGHPAQPRSAAAADHERRYRIRSAGCAHAGRKAGQGGRAATDRRLRFRSDHHHRAGRRAARNSAGHQYRGGAGNHRAGLQIRVPQFSDCAGGARRGLQQPEAGVRSVRRHPEIGRLLHVNDTLGKRDAEGRRRDLSQARHALQDHRDHRLRSEIARSVARGLHEPRPPARRRCWSPAGSTTRSLSPANWSSSAGTRPRS